MKKFVVINKLSCYYRRNRSKLRARSDDDVGASCKCEVVSSFQQGPRSKSSPTTITAAPHIIAWEIYRCTSAKDGAEKNRSVRPPRFRSSWIPWRRCRTLSASCRTKRPLRIRPRSLREPPICITWRNYRSDLVREYKRCGRAGVKRAARSSCLAF